jgi:alpha/beta superfamily hydrolase
MLPILTTSGEHLFTFQGGVGILEAILTMPNKRCGAYIALLGHPHPLQGGSMTNKVVTTMARAFKELGIPSIRFNFRGVGQSAGNYDAGMGESEDMLILRQLWLDNYPNNHIIWAGFSFGSYVAYRACARSNHGLLLTIAPPIHHYSYQEWLPTPNPWVIFQGDCDEIVPLSLILDFAACTDPVLSVVRFSDAGHFFHNHLIVLKSEIIRVVQQWVFDVN